jgi:hypothetical protein
LIPLFGAVPNEIPAEEFRLYSCDISVKLDETVDDEKKAIRILCGAQSQSVSISVFRADGSNTYEKAEAIVVHSSERAGIFHFQIEVSGEWSIDNLDNSNGKS